jgi:hypothetical protein
MVTCALRIPDEKAKRRQTAITLLIAASFYVLFAAACGAPGEPAPPAPIVPVPVADLSAQQHGDGVELTFTIPSRSTAGERLTEPPAIEILRGTLRSNGAPDQKSFQPVYTIPGALAGAYLADGHIHFTDPIDPAVAQAHPGAVLVYRVRTRASKKRASGDSNTVAVAVYPVAERISPLETRVTQDAIVLSWAAPQRTSGGEPLTGATAISSYHIYRGELDPSSAQAATKNLADAKWVAPLRLLAPSATNEYRDTQFEFGKTYAYAVRSVIAEGGRALESADSAPGVVTPRDIFPPAAPTGLAAAVLSAVGAAAFVDLSWNISSEPDLAGYRVYRSDEQGASHQLLTPQLLLSPAHRDMSVQAGHRYSYTVTAVDRSGNESALSAPVIADLTQPSE